MVLRSVGRVIAVGLLASALLFPSGITNAQTPAAHQPSPPVHRVFSSIDDFKAAAAIDHATGFSANILTEDEKEARHQLVSETFNRLNPKDKDQWEKAAADLGVLVYNPNLNRGETMSQTGDLHTIFEPIKTYDPVAKEFYLQGIIEWLNSYAISGDCPITGCTLNSPIGGVDAAGLIMDGWQSSTSGVRYSIQTYDKLGRLSYYTSNASTKTASSGRFAVIFTGQDTYLGTDADGKYNWWKINVWVYYPAAYDSVNNGTVFTTYTHTWRASRLQSWGFTAGPGVGAGKDGLNWNVGLGFSFSFNVIDESFGIPGFDGTY